MKQLKRPPMAEKLKTRLTANPKINVVNMNIPLSNGTTTPKLKNILESDVDAKYYLSNSTVERIICETNFTERLVSITINKESEE